MKGPTTILHPAAISVSQPVTVNEVQSAAFWVHPRDPAKSLVFITNEYKGLEVHDPATGLLLKHVQPTIQPKYVDVLYDFPLKDGPGDLVLASCAGLNAVGVKVWRIDPEKRKLSADLTPGRAIAVFDGGEPAGVCAYHSRKTGKSYFFVTLRDGKVGQYELTVTDNDEAQAKRVRTIELKSEVKSCQADEETGAFYVAEDDVGIWRYAAEPDATDAPKRVIPAGDHGLAPNVRGPAIYGAAGGKGYLLALSQSSKGGHPIVNVYERGGDNRYVCTIDPSPAGVGGRIDHSSEIAVTNQPLGPTFPAGALAINDQLNPNASEDFKFYSWADVAKAGGLIVDTTWSRRGNR